MAQTDRILDYMKTFGSINPIQAMKDLGVMRLASRINDLRRLGVKIHKATVSATNRYGETVYFAQYSLED